DVRFDGMTDRGIVRAGLAVVGEATAGAGAEAAIDAILADYIPLLEEEIARTDGFRLHRGVADALDAAERPGIPLGPGTGHTRDGARAKLAFLGVFDRFRFGGFGCDHEDRATILRIGAERGARALGIPLADCRVVVIGDTPRDVAAALAINADSIAIAT